MLLLLGCCWDSFVKVGGWPLTVPYHWYHDDVNYHCVTYAKYVKHLAHKVAQDEISRVCLGVQMFTCFRSSRSVLPKICRAYADGLFAGLNIVF